MKVLALFLVLSALMVELSFGQNSTLKIEVIGNSTLDFCKDSIQFGSHFSIVGDSIFGGLKVSIANYKNGSEKLACRSTVASITTVWDGSNGSMQLKGSATTAEFQKVLSAIWYVNQSAIPDLTTRDIAISLIDVDYLPATNHFYQFVKKTGIKWTEAKLAAANMRYYGLQGYMATITSKTENDFVWTKISGIGWIGATDEEIEGEWKWATGPEAGTLFWKGNGSGLVVNGAYSFWGNGEPNNSNPAGNGGIGEDYAHITQNPNQPAKSWNDLRDGGDGPNSQYYYPQGYVVEFGGMTGDPQVKLSASFQIKMRKVIFDAVTDKTICLYDQVELNHAFDGSYQWSPSEGLSNNSISNPITSPANTTTYKVVANNNACKDSANFTVHVNPVPTFDLGTDQNLCAGDKTTLDAKPLNEGTLTSYLWNVGTRNQTLNVDKSGKYIVTVKNEFNCSTKDSIQVTVHSFPEINISDKEILVCDSYIANPEITIDKGTIDWSLSSANLMINNRAIGNPKIETNQWGTYAAFIKVADAYNCISLDTIQLKYYKTPNTTISIDSMTCSGYNLHVTYKGDGTKDALYSWFFPDTLYTQGYGLDELSINLGFQQTNSRRLGLIVNENGCKSSIDWTPVKVTPNLEIKADLTEGCQPLDVKLNAETTEEIVRFSWDLGGSQFNDLPNSDISHTFADAGAYDVKLKIESVEGCENTGLIKDFITVWPIKTLTTDIDSSRCYPHEFDVVYSGTGTSADQYLWNLSGLDPEEIINNPGTASGQLTISLKNKPQASINLKIISDKGCESAVNTFKFKRKPWVDLFADQTSGCAPLDVTFSAKPIELLDNLNFDWNTGFSIVEKSIELSYSEKYTDDGKQYQPFIVANSLTTSCSDTVLLDSQITIFENPVAEFEPDQSEKLISDARFQFTNLSTGAIIFDWDFDNGQVSQEKAPEYNYEHVGKYNVLLQVQSELGCKDSVSHQILVAPENLFPPNAINPNSSNPENHIFLLTTEAVKDIGYHMQIYNRWGGLVFESTNKSLGWDGKMKNGNFAPAGTYVWTLTYQDIFDKNRKQSGTVNLVF